MLLGVLAVGALGFLLIRGLRALTGQSSANQLLVQLDEPVISIPEETPTSPLSGEMNQETAQRVLEFWLSTKKEAMGESHVATKLDQILIDPKLTEWRTASEEAKRDGMHVTYEHTIRADSAEVNVSDPKQAIVMATASETRNYYKGSDRYDTQTDGNLKVRYTLVLQDNQWRIKDWQVQ
ncbi:MAG: DUF4101 domain-containing protein [Leptolyngbyaceae cyanobacterium SU_3_3]|nr:DUF4101 domain-containing protein [Leptolyngbyaceae cyanobacterium SU_3_3]